MAIVGAFGAGEDRLPIFSIQSKSLRLISASLEFPKRIDDVGKPCTPVAGSSSALSAKG